MSYSLPAEESHRRESFKTACLGMAALLLAIGSVSLAVLLLGGE